MAWAHAELGFTKVKREAVAEFFRKILRKKDFMIMVVGEKGSGKSFAVGSLCEMIDPTFCRDDVISDINNLKTRLREKIEIGNEIGVMNLDDFGSELDPNEFLSDMARDTSHLMQKSRTFHVGFFITVPDRALINKTMRDRLSNYMIEVLGHNEHSGFASVKIFRIDVNKRTGKVYYHRLSKTSTGEITTKKRGNSPIVCLLVPKPSKHFMDWYLPFRSELALKELEIKEKALPKNKSQLGFNIEDIRKDSDMVLSLEDKYVKFTKQGNVKLKAELLMSEFGYTASRLTALEDYMSTNKLLDKYKQRYVEEKEAKKNKAVEKVVAEKQKPYVKPIKDYAEEILTKKDRYVRLWQGKEVLNKALLKAEFNISHNKVEVIDRYVKDNNMISWNTPVQKDVRINVGEVIKQNKEKKSIEACASEILAKREKYINVRDNKTTLNSVYIKADFNIGSDKVVLIDRYLKENKLI